MAFDNSLFDYDAGYYQYTPGGWWLHGKMVENGDGTFSRRAVEAAINVDLDDSDVLLGTYPKTGKNLVGFSKLKSRMKIQNSTFRRSTFIGLGLFLAIITNAIATKWLVTM